jgi:MFS family permease
MAWLTFPALLGPVVGPPLGGVIVTYASWRWIFDINVPIGVAGIILASLFIRDVRQPRPGPFDGLGLLLSGLGLLLLMAGLETIGRPFLPTAASASLILAGLALGVLYAAHARRTPSPILDISLLAIPTFRVSVTAGTLFRIGIGAIPFLLPLMLQLGFGRSAAESGMITFATSAGALVMKPVTAPLLRRFGFRWVLIWNGVVSATLLAACAAFRPDWAMSALYAVLLVGGFVRSLQFTAYNTIAYADIPKRRLSAATSLYATIQQVSLTLGVVAGAAALEAATFASGRAMPALRDYSLAFLAVALVSLLAAPTAIGLDHDAGSELTKRRDDRP